MHNKLTESFVRTPQRVAIGIIGLLSLSGCINGGGAIDVSPREDSETIESVLARSLDSQPLVVKACPPGGNELPQGSGVNADALGRRGNGRLYLIIGDGAPAPLLEYDVDEDGIPDAWCGQAAENFNDELGVNEAIGPNTALVVIPNWPGCKLPGVGEQLECPHGPILFDPPTGIIEEGPSITIEIPYPTMEA